MRREPHPLTGTIYEDVGDGRARVSKKDSGDYGIFTWKGEWLEGAVTQADPHMLVYISGPDLPLDHEVFWMAAGSRVYDGSIPVDAPPGTHMAEMGRLVSGYTPDKGKDTPAGPRSSGFIDAQFFIDNERFPERMSDAFRRVSPMEGGPQKIGTERFYSREYHDLEVERIWQRAWQMACREDDIPNVGDYHVYEIAHLSFLVVRVSEDEIQAFQNVCLHRGRLLKDCSGKGAKEFMCPYHGWAWHTDGSLKSITAEWDFPGMREDAAQLPHAQVGRWGGFVFINPDMAAGPLEEFLGPVMIDYYRKYRLQDRYKQAHVQKLVRANWKVVMEAFMESYHVIATHPHQMLLGGDLANADYDVFGNWGRAGIFPSPGSPQRGIEVSLEDALAQWRAGVDSQRALLKGMYGIDTDQFADIELQGGFHDLFPNLHPWGGWSRICFRFRPHGDNPDESIMDAMLLAPWPDGEPKPAPAKVRKLGFDDAWTSAPELLSLSKIMDQDVGNLPSIQKGLKAKQPPHVWYSAYQEGKIRNFHRNYERALGIEGSEQS